MFLRRLLCGWITISFLATIVIPPQRVYAQTILNLPEPGTMVSLSPAYTPVLIKGLKINPNDPLNLDFIVATGNSQLTAQDPQLKKESEKLIKYFFAALTLPEKDVWVNLSPYEKDRIVPQATGETEMGRDMLAQDYILKQITASLIYPEKGLGKDFWNRIYAEAYQRFGTTQIPVNTFNKVWIVADKASVYEAKDTVFVVNSHLKVMLEEDYMALNKHEQTQPINNTHALGSQVVREIILPALEKEVNEGKNFANLRQIFHSLILAKWYKETLKTALLNQVYSNKDKIAGVDVSDKNIKEKIYRQYLMAYKKGVFNYIKEDIDQTTKEPFPKKYFSGGVDAAMVIDHATSDEAVMSLDKDGSLLMVSSKAEALQTEGISIHGNNQPSGESSVEYTPKGSQEFPQGENAAMMAVLRNGDVVNLKEASKVFKALESLWELDNDVVHGALEVLAEHIIGEEADLGPVQGVLQNTEEGKILFDGNTISNSVHQIIFNSFEITPEEVFFLDPLKDGHGKIYRDSDLLREEIGPRNAAMTVKGDNVHFGNGWISSKEQVINILKQMDTKLDRSLRSEEFKFRYDQHEEKLMQGISLEFNERGIRSQVNEEEYTFVIPADQNIEAFNILEQIGRFITPDFAMKGSILPSPTYLIRGIEADLLDYRISDKTDEKGQPLNGLRMIQLKYFDTRVGQNKDYRVLGNKELAEMVSYVNKHYLGIEFHQDKERSGDRLLPTLVWKSDAEHYADSRVVSEALQWVGEKLHEIELANKSKANPAMTGLETDLNDLQAQDVRLLAAVLQNKWLNFNSLKHFLSYGTLTKLERKEIVAAKGKISLGGNIGLVLDDRFSDQGSVEELRSGAEFKGVVVVENELMGLLREMVHNSYKGREAVEKLNISWVGQVSTNAAMTTDDLKRGDKIKFLERGPIDLVISEGWRPSNRIEVEVSAGIISGKEFKKEQGETSPIVETPFVFPFSASQPVTFKLGTSTLIITVDREGNVFLKDESSSAGSEVRRVSSPVPFIRMDFAMAGNIDSVGIELPIGFDLAEALGEKRPVNPFGGIGGDIWIEPFRLSGGKKGQFALQITQDEQVIGFIIGHGDHDQFLEAISEMENHSRMEKMIDALLVRRKSMHVEAAMIIGEGALKAMEDIDRFVTGIEGSGRPIIQQEQAQLWMDLAVLNGIQKGKEDVLVRKVPKQRAILLAKRINLLLSVKLDPVLINDVMSSRDVYPWLASAADAARAHPEIEPRFLEIRQEWLGGHLKAAQAVGRLKALVQHDQLHQENLTTNAAMTALVDEKTWQEAERATGKNRGKLLLEFEYEKKGKGDLNTFVRTSIADANTTRIRGEGADKAALASPTGGIDLNASKLDLQKTGSGIEIKFDPAMIEQFKLGHFNGIVPVITGITLIANIYPLLGLKEPSGAAA